VSDTIRWGILGPGGIAKQFARGLAAIDNAELAAVGSRCQANADAFGDEFDVSRRHASYAALADDPDVDAIYVSTPHPFHRLNTILCLEAGKAVLCEKPFAVNAADVGAMIDCARRNGRFLMEAHWSRFLPTLVQTREWLASGAIGEVRAVLADFGFRAGWDPEGRLLNPDLAGGGLLDVGCYLVSLASMVFDGPPAEIASAAHIGDSGVDEQAAMLFSYPGGRFAQLACAVRTGMPQEARILGTEGMIHLPSPWWCGDKVTLKAGEDEDTRELPFDGTGYNCEAVEVGDCLRAGKLESDIMPLDESLAIMQTLDRVRAQWGLKYPME
jgi:dihydrodiol dehydrogenase / D-xylose 1-dehydrogenase (NADP)